MLSSPVSTSSCLDVEELLRSPSSRPAHQATAFQTPSNKHIVPGLPPLKDSYSKEELEVLCDFLCNLSEEEAFRLNSYSKTSVFTVDTLKMMSGSLGLPKNRKKEELIKQIRQRRSNQKVVKLIMEMQSKVPEQMLKAGHGLCGVPNTVAVGEIARSAEPQMREISRREEASDVRLSRPEAPEPVRPSIVGNVGSKRERLSEDQQSLKQLRAKNQMERQESEMRLGVLKENRRLVLITQIERMQTSLDCAASECMREFWGEQMKRSMTTLLDL